MIDHDTGCLTVPGHALWSQTTCHNFVGDHLNQRHSETTSKKQEEEITVCVKEQTKFTTSLFF